MINIHNRLWKTGSLAGLAGSLVLMACTAEPKEIIELPPPQTDSDISLESTIAARRSIRSYADRPLPLEKISQLCWSMQGITEEQRNLRASPSAGATYPLELYVATEDGVFRYIPDGHKLVKHMSDDVRGNLRRAALGQEMLEQAPVVFIIAADIRRTAGRYGERAKRYVLIEVGHAAQNLLLQAVALELASVPIGAFDDNAIGEAIDLPAEQQAFYLLPVGYPR